MKRVEVPWLNHSAKSEEAAEARLAQLPRQVGSDARNRSGISDCCSSVPVCGVWAQAKRSSSAGDTRLRAQEKVEVAQPRPWCFFGGCPAVPGVGVTSCLTLVGQELE